MSVCLYLTLPYSLCFEVRPHSGILPTHYRLYYDAKRGRRKEYDPAIALLKTKHVLHTTESSKPNPNFHPRVFLAPPALFKGSPARFLLPEVALPLPLSIAQPRKGLTLPSLDGPAGELVMSNFLDLVTLAVVGGEAGANLGAFGVATTSSVWAVGVERLFGSSMSVTASSSSSVACDLISAALAW
jgi:hypothetical protein